MRAIDGFAMKGRVQIEKNGLLVVDKRNLVVPMGRDWVAGRFNLEGNGSPVNTQFQVVHDTSGIANRSNGDIHFMSVGTGNFPGNGALLSTADGAYGPNRGVSDDPATAYVANESIDDPSEYDNALNISLQNEVDRVEMGTIDELGADSKYYGGEVLGGKIKYVAEFWPDTRFGTILQMNDGHFQPLCEAGLHCEGLNISESPDFLDGRGNLGDASFAQAVHDRMVARVVFPTISKGPLDMIRITWTITVGG